MTNIDLTEYAGLFISGIIIYVALSSYWCHKVDGRSGAGTSVLLSIVGMWISLGIVKLCDFNDASPETVLTIIIGTIFLPTIYDLNLVKKWVKDKQLSKIDLRIKSFKKEIETLNNQLNNRNKSLKLVSLIKICDADVSNIESHKELINIKQIDNTIKNKKNEIQKLITQRGSTEGKR